MTQRLDTRTLIQRLTSTDDSREVRELYRQWAETYDCDLESFGYVAPRIAVEQFCELLSERGALIYDAGCGTGQVGVLLRSHGYQRLHGADFSPEMLARAELGKAYRQLARADYSKPVEIAGHTYDAVISVGVYTARFERQFIPEMLRILKPGGLLYFTCRPHYFASDASAELQQLLIDGEIRALRIERRPYMLQENADAFYIAAHKNTE